MDIKPNSYYYNERSRSNLLNIYIKDMVSFYKRTNPNIDNDVLVGMVKDIIKEKINIPECIIHDFVSEGNIVKKKKSLMNIINDIGLDTIITPNGVGYMQAAKKCSFFTESILKDQAARSREKKIMIQAEIDKNDKIAKLKNRMQMNIKIGINSISGVMLKNVFFRSSNNYNAITSLARFGIQLSYSFIELFLMGNLFFRTEDIVINYVNKLLDICPSKETFLVLQKRHNLYIPSKEDVSNYLLDNLKLYSLATNTSNINQLINTLDIHELSFIYYAMNLKHIFQKNDFIKELINRCFHVNEITEDDLYFDDSDLITCVISIFPELLMKKGEKNPISLEDALHDKERKEIIGRYCASIKKVLSEIQDIFDLFIFIPFIIPNTTHHANMIRKVTVLSDTDSIFFTTINMVKWYTGQSKISSDAKKINSLIVYLISRTFIHLYAYMSSCLNVDEHNINKIEMKNEFCYSVLLRSPMAKNYAGLCILKEGNVIFPPKLDKKGKNFVGSDLCKTTLKEINDTFVYLLNSVADTGELSTNTCIKRVINFEQKIIKKLQSGDIEFLTQVGIKPKQDYKIPMISNYFYYLLWQECFAKKYGDLYVPQKCKIIPIYPISIYNISSISGIKESDPVIYENLVNFLKKYPKKKATKILIPTNIEIPFEVRNIIDYRSVVYKNCASLYLIYRSIGICSLASNKKKLLFSDVY